MFAKKLIDYSLKITDLKSEPEWLINKILAKSSIQLVCGKAGGGKSITFLTIALYLLKSNLIDRVIYVDGDNGKTTLKMRKMDDLINHFPSDKFLYIPSFKIDEDVIQLIHNELTSASNGNTLLVLDSLRNFMGNRDFNSDKDAIEFMNKLQEIREAGNTVVVLHHLNSNGNPKNNTSFNDYCDISYLLAPEENDNGELRIIFNNIKDRMGSLPSFTATVSFEQFMLKIEDKAIPKEDIQVVEVVRNLLLSKTANLTEIYAYAKSQLGEVGSKRVRKILDIYKDKLWQCTTGTCNSQNFNLLSAPNNLIVDWKMSANNIIKTFEPSGFVEPSIQPPELDNDFAYQDHCEFMNMDVSALSREFFNDVSVSDIESILIDIPINIDSENDHLPNHGDNYFKAEESISTKYTEGNLNNRNKVERDSFKVENAEEDYMPF